MPGDRGREKFCPTGDPEFGGSGGQQIGLWGDSKGRLTPKLPIDIVFQGLPVLSSMDPPGPLIPLAVMQVSAWATNTNQCVSFIHGKPCRNLNLKI